MLRALLRDLGIEARVLPIAKDDLSSLKTQIDEAANAADIVIVTGGVSVGKYDLTKPALESLGASILFDRVELKPGKPAVFAMRKKNLFFGLPGNPVSVAVTFFLFVRHAVMRMQGASEPKLPGGFAVLENKIKANKERDTYQPVTLATSADGRLIAVPLKWHGSSDFIGFARCDALATIPKGESIEAGDVTEILFL
jgi:molybdenum cofactor synthesis domain-containing protein